jgi:D-glycero-D-manno-heptose 1,7-bisphosphate phosphatase
LPGSRDAIAQFTRAGYRVVIVSNQAGINRGAMTRADVEAIHVRMKSDVVQSGGRIDAIYYCPHDWDEGCDCRKPKPGMLFQAQRDLSLDMSRTLFIGDDDRDKVAADAAECPFQQVTADRSLLHIASDVLKRDYRASATSLASAG